VIAVADPEILNKGGAERYRVGSALPQKIFMQK